jgi:osmotically-inducible protein OsmY
MQSSDERIKKDIVENLYWDNRVDASDITVIVDEGVVRLHGSLNSLAARSAAEEDAVCVSGIEGVENNINVQLQKHLGLSDQEIRSMVEKVILWNNSIDSLGIEVKVNNGIVTLNGTVGSLWEKTRAEDLSIDIIGVKGVINNLAVVLTGNYVDELIAKRISESLKLNVLIDLDKVDVVVNKGMVKLTGKVQSQYAKKRAGEISLQTTGVTLVENLLTFE